MSEDFAEEQTKEYLIGDGKKILGMFFTCFVFLMLYTQSAFLASVSILNVIMSIPVTLYIYKRILRIDYFSSIHVPFIFITVCFGSNYILVFHNNW